MKMKTFSAGAVMTQETLSQYCKRFRRINEMMNLNCAGQVIICCWK